MSSGPESHGSDESPFLAIPTSEWLASNRSGFAIFDRYPVNEGHALVISRRLICDWWEAYPEEQADLMALVAEVKQQLDQRYSPSGYNVGFNAGAAAGQTIFHLHIHVIPRYPGDTPSPAGGVRHVFPDKANYLSSNADVGTPHSPRLLDSLDGRFLHGGLGGARRDPDRHRGGTGHPPVRPPQADGGQLHVPRAGRSGSPRRREADDGLDAAAQPAQPRVETEVPLADVGQIPCAFRNPARTAVSRWPSPLRSSRKGLHRIFQSPDEEGCGSARRDDGWRVSQSNRRRFVVDAMPTAYGPEPSELIARPGIGRPAPPASDCFLSWSPRSSIGVSYR